LDDVSVSVIIYSMMSVRVILCYPGNNRPNNNNKRALVMRQYTKMSSSAVQPIKT